MHTFVQGSNQCEYKKDLYYFLIVLKNYFPPARIWKIFTTQVIFILYYIRASF